MSIQSYRDLRVWQAGVDIAENVYRVTRDFPKHELYGLAGQMQRAAVSIPSNIAEGHTREHTKEYLHHLSMAQASLAEMETQSEIARRLAYITDEQLAALRVSAEALGRQLYALRNAVMKRDAVPRPPAPAPRPPVASP